MLAFQILRDVAGYGIGIPEIEAPRRKRKVGRIVSLRRKDEQFLVYRGYVFRPVLTFPADLAPDRDIQVHDSLAIFLSNEIDRIESLVQVLVAYVSGNAADGGLI